MKNYLQKIAPDREKLQNHATLRPIAHWLANPKIWYFNRRTVAVGVAIGLFFGSLPIAGQMPLAAIIAIISRANMPVAILSTWVSNPITMPFFFTANYYFGAWLLHRSTVDLSEVEWTLDGLISLSGEVLIPLYLGSVVVGLLLAILAFLSIRISWRWSIVRSHHERKRHRSSIRD